MGKIRCMLAVMAMAIGTGVAYAVEGNSEKDYRPYPHMFFGLNGGAQVDHTELRRFVRCLFQSGRWSAFACERLREQGGDQIFE